MADQLVRQRSDERGPTLLRDRARDGLRDAHGQPFALQGRPALRRCALPAKALRKAPRDQWALAFAAGHCRYARGRASNDFAVPFQRLWADVMSGPIPFPTVQELAKSLLRRIDMLAKGRSRYKLSKFNLCVAFRAFEAGVMNTSLSRVGIVAKVEFKLPRLLAPPSNMSQLARRRSSQRRLVVLDKNRLL